MVVGKDHVVGVGHARVGAKAKGRVDSLTSSGGRSKSIGPVDTTSSVYLSITETLCQVTLVPQKVIDVLLIELPQGLILPPGLVVIHQELEALIKLWIRITEEQEPKWSNGTILIISLVLVHKLILDLVSGLGQDGTLFFVVLANLTLVIAHWPSTCGTGAESTFRLLQTVQTHRIAVHLRSLGQGVVVQDQLYG